MKQTIFFLLAAAAVFASPAKRSYAEMAGIEDAIQQPPAPYLRRGNNAPAPIPDQAAGMVHEIPNDDEEFGGIEDGVVHRVGVDEDDSDDEEDQSVPHYSAQFGGNHGPVVHRVGIDEDDSDDEEDQNIQNIPAQFGGNHGAAVHRVGRDEYDSDNEPNIIQDD